MKDKESSDIFIEALKNLPEDIISAKYEGLTEPAGIKNKKKKNILFDKVIDLHGFKKEDAITILRNSLIVSRGKRHHILIITGKGNHSENNVGVIKESVRSFLEKTGSVYIRQYKTALPKDGGDGAFEIFTK